MPQGRRKIPFSGKKKKQQIVAKRQTKVNYLKKIGAETSDEESDSSVQNNVQRVNYQPIRDGKSNPNRYVLQFYKETEKQLKEMKEDAKKSLVYVPEKELEISDQYFIGYDFPKRPKWTYEMSKSQLERNEHTYFRDYVSVLEKFHYDEKKPLNYYELNLETWRQLWRVLELSDVILIIVDVRYASLMFPPALYDYVTKELGKNMIIVLNKIDLVPSSLVLAWQKYFQTKYKSIHVVLFTSCPSYNLHGKQNTSKGLKIRRRRGRPHMATEGAQQIFRACKLIAKDAVDLTSWDRKITEEANLRASFQGGEDDDDTCIAEQTHEEEKDFDFEEHELYKNGVLTIGCIGFPNVGKSSLMNALMGRKVVSVSKTPGHTKYFQTIFLTNTVRLCDCPGLVFPSGTPRKIQVLMGGYPIAQLREPFASLRFLCERLDLPKILDVDHPEGANREWTPFDVCDAWALKRGFLTAKAARPDTFRAANNILRMALDGKLTLCLKPIGYTENIQKWENHSDIAEVKRIQALLEIEPNDYNDPLPSFSETETDHEEDSVGVELAKGSEDDIKFEKEQKPVLTKNAFSMLSED